MAEVINMPRLSDTMEEGVVAKWLKKKGDKIEEGDILAEIETDKATMEFESFYSGTLLHIGLEEGEAAPVDSLLAIIGEEGEDISGLLEGGASEVHSEASEKREEKPEEELGAAPGGEIPEGVEVINMPRLSDTMEEGTVATWLKKEGDKVEEGDILAEIETDKATMEFESFYSGTLLYIGIKEGESAPVDTVLAIIGPEGTDVSAVLSGGGKAKAASSEKPEAKEEAASSGDSSKPAAPEAAKDGGRIFVSPLAKKMAEDLGIDLSQVKGSGENNRIVRKDIEAYKPSEKPAQQQAAAPQKEAAPEKSAVRPYVPAGEESFEEIKNSQMRKTIAKRLSESKFNAPH